MKVIYETSMGSLIKKGEELCGDKFDIKKTGGDTFIVLADGLGSGVKANILASLTSKIVITLLAQGTPIEDVALTMGSTLPVSKKRDIAYSTFTFIHADSEGMAEIVEFDNPDLVIIRDGKMLPLHRETVRAGNMKIRRSGTKLKAGDVIYLFSDGVVHAGVGAKLNLGWRHDNVVKFLESQTKPGFSALKLRDRLLSACTSLYLGAPGDDTTVSVCKVNRPNIATVMVGPPKESEDDEKVVQRLIDSEGIKIACGGTTSKVICRVTGRELRAELNYSNPKVPPMGYIEGIDIVSEGVITLSEVNHLLNEYEESGRALEFHGDDAASKIAHTLIEECTGINFLVGRGINPARDTADAQIDLNIKLRMIAMLVEKLRKMDKKVEVEYF